MIASREYRCVLFFFFQAEDGIRDIGVTGVQTCALPISDLAASLAPCARLGIAPDAFVHEIHHAAIVERLLDEIDRALLHRSEEHTSELQSRQYLVCRLLLEKKKKTTIQQQNKKYLMTHI